MVKPSESNPLGAQMAKAWEAGLSNEQIRVFRDVGYYNFWLKEVSTTLMMSPLNYGMTPNIPLILTGYTKLSQAIEDFDLSKQNFSEPSTRRFVLAENESQVRLKNQIETFLKAQESGPAQLIFVRNSEHDILSSQPEAYVLAVTTLLQTVMRRDSQIGVIDPSQKTQKVRWLDVREAQRVVDYILKFSDSTDAADLSPSLSK